MRRGVKVAVANLTAVTCMTACSSGEANKTDTPSPAHQSTSYSSSAPETLNTYLHDPARNAKLEAAVQRFGSLVVQVSHQPESPWGPLDLLCQNITSNGATIPFADRQPGEECAVISSPNTPHDAQHPFIAVWRRVAASKQLVATFDQATIIGSGDCTHATIAYNPKTNTQATLFALEDGRTGYIGDTTSTLAAAKIADAGALRCFTTVQP